MGHTECEIEHTKATLVLPQPAWLVWTCGWSDAQSSELGRFPCQGTRKGKTCVHPSQRGWSDAQTSDWISNRGWVQQRQVPYIVAHDATMYDPACTLTCSSWCALVPGVPDKERRQRQPVPGHLCQKPSLSRTRLSTLIAWVPDLCVQQLPGCCRHVHIGHQILQYLHLRLLVCGQGKRAESGDLRVLGIAPVCLAGLWGLWHRP